MDRNYKRTPSIQALDPLPTHLDDTAKVPNFKHCTSNAQGPPPPPWTRKFRSYLLPSYSTDIWKTIKSQRWHNSRVKTNTSIIHALDPPPTHPPRYQTSNIAHRMPRAHHHPPGHVSSGPIFCLHTRQISELKVRDDTLLDWKQTLQSSRHLTHHPPTWTTAKVPSFIPRTLNDQGPPPPPWIQVLSFAFILDRYLKDNRKVRDMTQF